MYSSPPNHGGLNFKYPLSQYPSENMGLKKKQFTILTPPPPLYSYGKVKRERSEVGPNSAQTLFQRTLSRAPKMWKRSIFWVFLSFSTDSINKHGYFPEKSTIEKFKTKVNSRLPLPVYEKKGYYGPKIKDSTFPRKKVVISCQSLGIQIFIHLHKFRKISYITIPLVSLCSKVCFSWLFFWEKTPCERSRRYINFHFYSRVFRVLFDLPHMMAMFGLSILPWMIVSRFSKVPKSHYKLSKW